MSDLMNCNLYKPLCREIGYCNGHTVPTPTQLPKFDIEVRKADAFIIEPNKRYLVTFESDRWNEAEDIKVIQEQMKQLFADFGADAKVVVTFEGRFAIAEIKDAE